MNLRELIAIFGHELRTPLAAILGYQELLAEGIYGELGERQREPVERIQRSAEQILSLVDGLQELAAAGNPADDEVSSTDTGYILATLLDRLKPVADTRSVIIQAVHDVSATLHNFMLSRFLRAAEIAGVAAIKSSHGRTIRIACSHSNALALCTLEGSGLDPASDDPGLFTLDAHDRTPVTAAQLRLAMAAATLAVGAGSVLLLPQSGSTTLQLRLPVPVSSD
jgi:signal transduction histidine kinase